mmetsp:Transcript_65856/g.175350  ORF Transcript_65856/g.175350 Transcript_65856/m.175350 type:complete len:225 (+) Transcript_65856:271-945(+)
MWCVPRARVSTLHPRPLLARARLPRLQPLALSRIALEKPRLLERRPQVKVESLESRRDAMAHGPRLPADPAAAHERRHGVLADRVRLEEGLHHGDAVRPVAAQPLREVLPVDRERCRRVVLHLPQQDARRRALPAPCCVRAILFVNLDVFARGVAHRSLLWPRAAARARGLVVRPRSDRRWRERRGLGSRNRAQQPLARVREGGRHRVPQRRCEGPCQRSERAE